MRPLMAPALVLWGFQMDLWWLGALLGIALETPRWVRFRLEIAQRDFERLWSFTAVLFLGVVFYLLLADRGLGVAGSLLGDETANETSKDGILRVSSTALSFLRGVPLILAPFVVVHAWSTSSTLPWSTFSLYEQARARREPLVPPPTWAVQPMHPGFAYLGVVLFACITFPDPGTWFIPVWTLVVVLALWPWRNRHYGPVARAALLAVIAGVAWVAHRSHDVSRQAWDLMEQGLQAGLTSAPEIQHRTTALGTVGRLQQSSRILLRGDYPPGHPPTLLAEAVFDRFSGSRWDSSQKGWQPGVVEQAPLDPTLLTITRSTDQGRTVLVQPHHTQALRSLQSLPVERNQHGVVRLLDGLPVVVYQVVEGAADRLPPGEEDLSLAGAPPEDVEAAQAVLAELPVPTPEALAAWFAAKCRYTLDLEGAPTGTTPLANFLARHRAGHCEYFAAAAVVILRAAGHPARYVVGFVPATSPDGTWIARGRDAHAWVQWWNGSTWEEFDPTPPGWRVDSTLSWWDHVVDGWTTVQYAFDRWRSEGGNWRLVVLVVGLFILAWIAWRQVRGGRWWHRPPPSVPVTPVPGQDSPLLSLLDDLEVRCGPRAPGQSVRSWSLEHEFGGAAWEQALSVHERWRFDPRGITAQEHEELHRVVQTIREGLPLTQTRDPR